MVLNNALRISCSKRKKNRASHSSMHPNARPHRVSVCLGFIAHSFRRWGVNRSGSLILWREAHIWKLSGWSAAHSALSKAAQSRTENKKARERKNKKRRAALSRLWSESELLFGLRLVKPCAEEDSVLTQAASLLVPPLHGSETRGINERVGKKKGHRGHKYTRLVSLRVLVSH